MLNPITHQHDRPLHVLGKLLHEVANTLFQFLLLSLLLLGIGGFIYKALARDGWLTRLLLHAWNNDPVNAAITIGAIAMAGVWANWLLTKRLASDARTGNLLVYGCLGLGAFFGLQLIFTGSL